MATGKSTPYSGLFKRLLAPFQPEDEVQDGAAIQGAYESAHKINVIVGEVQRLAALRNAEHEKAATLSAELSEIEDSRITALAEATIEGIGRDDEHVTELLRKSAATRQRLGDCQLVAQKIQTRIDELNQEKVGLLRMYQNDLGGFLDKLFAHACDRYNKLAPGVAEAALQMAAIQNVMMRYKAGNSNGFERRIFLPAVETGNGCGMVPLLDGDTRHFIEATNSRMGDIVAVLKQAGFNYRFD